MSLTPPQIGHFSGIELATSDVQAAKKFYTEIFRWEYIENPMPDGTTYYMFGPNNTDMIGGMSQLNPEEQPGVPPNFSHYLKVKSADDTAKKVKALGGSILAEPFDVMEHGRMAVVMDPTGAAFSLWEGRAHAGYSNGGTVHGAVSWNELMTSDVEKALKFYSELMGWTQSKMPMNEKETYYTFNLGDTPVAGAMQISPEWGDNVPSNWGVYIHVDSCEKTLALCKKLGAKVVFGPSSAPGVGQFVGLQDLQGAHFNILQPE